MRLAERDGTRVLHGIPTAFMLPCGDSMRPAAWHPPLPLSPAEQAEIRPIRRAKLFSFLRRILHDLFAVPITRPAAIRDGV